MDIASVIRQRLDELGIEQRDLAAAAKVTESYISQLLAHKKMPPAPNRTDLYNKIARVLKVPSQELGRLADTQRREEMKRKVLDPPPPVFGEFRQLLLQRCVAIRRKQITGVFEREPFGECERFVTQKLLDVAQRATKKELADEQWLHLFARMSKMNYAEARFLILEFLDTDVLHVSAKSCIPVLDRLIESWDIELNNFGMKIVLNRRLVRNHLKELEFREVEPSHEIEAGLEQFLKDVELSANITEEETAFLKSLRFDGKRPSPLYYYRELQNLRDPLNFLPLSIIGKSRASKGKNGTKVARVRRVS